PGSRSNGSLRRSLSATFRASPRSRIKRGRNPKDTRASQALFERRRGVRETGPVRVVAAARSRVYPARVFTPLLSFLRPRPRQYLGRSRLCRSRPRSYGERLLGGAGFVNVCAAKRLDHRVPEV